MNTAEANNKKIAERIAEFHEYLNMGMDIESAKKIILEDTCLNAVKNYINNYK